MGKRHGITMVQKLMLWFLIAVLLPWVAISGYVYNNTINWYTRNVESDNLATLAAVVEKINCITAVVENGIRSLAYDPSVLKLLDGGHKSCYKEVTLQQKVVEEVLPLAKVFLSAFNTDIIIFSDSDKTLTTYWSVLHTSELTNEEDYRRFVDADVPFAWVGPALLRPSSTITYSPNNSKLFCCYRNIIGTNNRRIGVIKCGISLGLLFEAASSKEIDRDIYVMNSSGLIYGGSGLESITGQIDHDKTVQSIDGQLLLVRPIDDLGVALVMKLDTQEVRAQARRNCLMQLTVLTLAITLLLIVTLLFFQKIKHRMGEAIYFANEARSGKMDVIFPDPGTDEIGQLIDAFNELLVRLQEQAVKRIENEKKEQHALRLALQYQINPHFLFNSLNWVQMSLSMNADREMVAQSIVLLGKLLRYNMDGSATTTLQEETENIVEYVQMINLRKNNMVSLEIHTDGIDPQQTVMRFMFQPVCENAIQHGMIAGQLLHIRIIGNDKGDMLQFTIENDGAEISDGCLEQIRSAMEIEPGEHGIGFSNIASRLKLLYGDQAGIQVSSQPGRTSVELRLAKSELIPMLNEVRTNANPDR